MTTEHDECLDVATHGNPFRYCGRCGWMETPSDAEKAEAERLLSEIAQALNDIYAPSGVLMFWSSRNRRLNDRRPCDIWSDNDNAALRDLHQQVCALADGNLG